MTGFFMPPHAGQAGEDAYERLRAQTEQDMGRPPSRRRISELWTRRGNLDCVTVVGSPDPISGDTVIAIFDMGAHQPFVLYREGSGDPPESFCEILGCNAYSITEFSR